MRRTCRHLLGFIGVNMEETAASPLQLVARWPLGMDVFGRLDHMALDSATGLLVVNALEANRTLVMNTSTGSIVDSIDDLANPQGARIISTPTSMLAISSALDGSVRGFDTSSVPFQQVFNINLGLDADNIRNDTASASFFVGFGDKSPGHKLLDTILPTSGIVQIDITTGALLGVAALPAHAESFQLAPAHIFVNVPEANSSVVVIDRTTNKVASMWVASWKNNTQLRGNHAMAMLPPSTHPNRLLVGYRAPPVMALFDTLTGDVLTAVPCADDADDIWFDAAAGRVYMTGGGGAHTNTTGDGKLLVYDMVGDTITQLAEMPTSDLARTSAFDDATRHLFVAVPRIAGGTEQASILVYRAATPAGIISD